MSTRPPPLPEKGRGARFDPQNRFRSTTREEYDDGWAAPVCDAGDDPAGGPENRGDDTGRPGARSPETLRAGGVATTVTAQLARSIIARNDSPDIPFTQSINPYQGCEHGCIYCYARPSHAYLDLSPGLEFETRLFAKTNAAELLRRELSRPGYVCEPIAFGTNTDAYQPIERTLRITRSVIEVLAQCDHPLSIVTKSALVERDIDLLAPMAAKNLVRVYLSVTTLEASLARTMEPRAAAPHRRLATIRALSDAGIPVGVMIAPVIPALNDRDIEAILEAAAAHGARSAGWILLRLPHEVKTLFKDWLAVHHPLRAGHVMSLVRQLRGGRENDPSFGSRMRGQGLFADLIDERFRVASRRLGLEGEHAPLDTKRFRPPRNEGEAPAQLGLF